LAKSRWLKGNPDNNYACGWKNYLLDNCDAQATVENWLKIVLPGKE